MIRRTAHCKAEERGKPVRIVGTQVVEVLRFIPIPNHSASPPSAQSEAVASIKPPATATVSTMRAPRGSAA